MSNNKINSESKTKANKKTNNIKTKTVKSPKTETNKQKNNEVEQVTKQKATSSKSNKPTIANQKNDKTTKVNDKTKEVIKKETTKSKTNNSKNIEAKKEIETKKSQVKESTKSKTKLESEAKTIDESKTAKVKANIKTKASETQAEIKSKTIKSKTSSSSSSTTKKVDNKLENKKENLKNKTTNDKTNEQNNIESSIKQPISNSKNNIFKKIINIVSLSIKTLFIISFIMNLVFLLKMDILPTKYLLIFILVSSIIILFAVLTEFILKSKIMKLISTTLSLIFIIFYIFAYIYLNKTHTFINGLFNNEQIETYYIAVLEDSVYEEIEDLKNLKIGSYYNNEESYNQVINTINNLIEYDEQNYETLVELYNNLTFGEIDAIFINEANKNIIEENQEIFDIKLRYIYNVDAVTQINISSKDLNVIDTPFIVYITGIDTYGEIYSTARSDVNIIAVINPKIKKILLLTIPRDYYVQLHNTTGIRDKLTHAGMYGIDMSASTIEDLLDIDINYYVRLNFSTLINAIDAIGGVEVYSPYTFNTYGYQFYEGYNYLNGDYALAFSRARYNFEGGDRTRGENQMRVIEAVINKISSSRVLVTNYLDILNSLSGTFQTNIDSNQIYDLVKMQLSTMPKWQIETYSLNGYDSSNYTYSMGDMLLYVMEPDYNTVNEAKIKINELLEKN